MTFSSKKEKFLRLQELIEEKKRRLRARKEAFVPHEGQLRVIQSCALEKYLFCGNGFGKTALLVNAVHWAATGINPLTGIVSPVPSKMYLVVDDPSKIAESFLPEYLKWNILEPEQLHKDGKPYVSRITYPNGSQLAIITHEVNLLKVEGVEATHIFFDEPPPRHIYIGLKRGGRIKGRPLEILMAGTPLYQPWLRTDIYKPWTKGDLPHVECFNGEMDENPHLESGYAERFGAGLTEQEKLTRFKGAFADLAGQALAHLWSPQAHIIPKAGFKFDARWPCVIAIDPHSSKPHHALLLGVLPDDFLVVLDTYSEKAVARGFAKSLIDRGWFTNYRIIDAVYDSAGQAEMTSGEGFRPFSEVFNEELTAHGIVVRIRATTYEDKSDEDFIERIRGALVVPEEPDSYGRTLPKLRVLEGNAGLISDIEEVQWVVDRRLALNKPHLDIRNKDYLACLKYALACNLFFSKGKPRIYRRKQGVYGFNRPRTKPVLR